MRVKSGSTPAFDDFSIAKHKTTAPIIKEEFQCLISDFCSAAHRDFFLEMVSKSRVNDCYQGAFFICNGHCKENQDKTLTRCLILSRTVSNRRVCTGWQTSGTVRCAVWPSTSGTATPNRNTATPIPRKICSAVNLPPYFMEGIKVRYPEYCRSSPAPKQQEK